MSRAWLLLLALAATGCSEGCNAAGRTVVVYTSVDQVFAEPLLRAFERQSGIKVRALFDTEETKSTGVVNRLIAEGTHPRADVFWSGDPVRPFLLLRRGLVARFRPRAAARLPAGFYGKDGRWSGLAARARVLLLNNNKLGKGPRPRSIRDLADPRFKGRAAIANPLFGTTTMHVAALFSAWGDAKAKAFLRALKRNGVRVASSNGEVKRLVVGGEAAFGLTDTDDAHEAVKAGAPVSVVYPDADGLGTLVMPTTLVLLRGAPHAANGRRLIEHLLSPAVEAQLARRGAHMPLLPGVSTPRGVRRVDQIRAMRVDYAAVAATMRRIQPWLRSWVGL